MAVLINSSHVFFETFQLPVSPSISFLFFTIGLLNQNLKAYIQGTHSSQVYHLSHLDHISNNYAINSMSNEVLRCLHLLKAKAINNRPL